MNTPPFCTLNRSCDEILQWAKTELTQAGLCVIQTFDLHTARHRLEDCPCPHHGTDTCECQMVVLLVYGDANDPATLILHGNDGRTWISIVNNPRQIADMELSADIRFALEKAVDSHAPFV